MLEYGRIDVSEGIDSTCNKLVSRECLLCHFWYYLDKNFNYPRYLCNGCHDMSRKANSMHNLAIAYNNGSKKNMSKNDVLNLMKNDLIIDKRGVL